MATAPVRIAILDDHQSTIDGYFYRLEKEPALRIVGAVRSGEELETLLAQQPADVVLVDVYVPASPANTSPYPLLFAIPRLQERYPNLTVLVISMHTDPSLIKALLDAGVSGYILKDDSATIRALAEVVQSVAAGGVHFSAKVFQSLQSQGAEEPLLTRRQLEALSLCAAYPGDYYTQVAEKMGVAESTVRNLLSAAYTRLGVHHLAEAIQKARELRLITPLTPPAPELQSPLE